MDKKTVIITADRLFAFKHIASTRNQKTTGISKFGYALNKVADSLQSVENKFNSESTNIKLKYCLKEGDKPQGALMKDARGMLQYSEKGQTDMNEAVRKYADGFKSEIKSYFISKEQIPSDLTSEELVILEGILIEEDVVKDLLENPPVQGTK